MSKRPYSCEESTAMIEDMVDEADVIVLPPDNDADTDVDDDGDGVDDDELDDDVGVIKNMPTHLEVQGDLDDNDKADSEAMTNKQVKVEQMTGRKRIKREKNIGEAKFSETLKKNYPWLQNMEPYELFQLYFDNNLIQHLVEQTILYADQQLNPHFSISNEEMQVFLGFILYTGYNRLPHPELHWSLDEDLRATFVSQKMTKNRYKEIKQYIHFADNTKLPRKNTLGKLKPLFDMLNNNLKQFGIFERDLNIDKIMVPYYAQHKGKLHMTEKPIKLGYKLWILASSSGYPFHFSLYTGTEHKTGLCLREKLMMETVGYFENRNQYCIHMGGMRALDAYLEQFRPIIGAFKWWWPLFQQCVNMAVVAAWRLHTSSSGALSHLHFRRLVVRRLMNKLPKKRAAVSIMPSDALRKSDMQHLPVTARSQGRCKHCKKNTRMQCSCCQVRVHLICFRDFHNK